MKYKHRDELVAGLRELADFIEDRGLQLPIDYPNQKFRSFVYPEYTDQNSEISGSAVKKMAKVAKAMAPCQKSWGDHYLDVTRRFGPIVLEFTASRNAVCTPKVVGQKLVPQQIIPARTEDIIEYECEDVSLLAALDREVA